MSDERFPDLRALHTRHHGLTVAVCHAYAEAAHVCLSRYHEPPIDVVVAEQTFVMEWDVPGDRARSAWANLVDAVEAGAYAMAIAAVEVTRGWFALSRAETLTGADYYVGPPGASDTRRALHVACPRVRRGISNRIYTRFRSREAVMTDREHQNAQELASEAAAAYKSGRFGSAATLYRRAAEHEARALATVPPDKPRTRGIVGVSLAALHFKAGDHDEAQRVAKTLLASDLPDDARAQLEEIIEAAKVAHV